jgi:RNA polymerase sigma factor (sigma-70 family)
LKVLAFPTSTPTRSIAERNALVEQVMHIVRGVAGGIAARMPPSFSIDELESVGYLGLVQAAERWNPERGEWPMYARCQVQFAIQEQCRRRHYKAETMEPFDFPSEDGDTCVKTDRAEFAHYPEHVEQIQGNQMRAHIEAALWRLSDRGQIVVRAFLDGVPTDQVMAQLGVGESRVIQMRNQAFAKLREAPELQAYRPTQTFTFTRKAA